MDDFAQQLINGLSLGSIYALVALGYTMVYGVLRFINFANGEVLMVGAYAAYYLAPFFQQWLGGNSILAALAVTVASMTICAILGVAIERFAYRPLRSQAKLTVLITSIGVSLLLAYGGQILFDPGQKPFPELIKGGRVEIGAGITISTNYIVVIAVTLVLLVLLRQVVLGTRYGLAVRALSQNPTAAALIGVDADAVISRTFAIGSALAGVAGILYAMNVHSIDPFMGAMPGIKAFTAAVLGGIGSIPGAAVGALILGLVEAFVGGSQFSSYRDAIAFGILVVILLVRPSGLFGSAAPEKV